MPMFERDDGTGRSELYFEDRGGGFPILMLAPGGMNSRIAAWRNAPWNPISALEGSFRVIAMDQRNAGRSVGPIQRDDGWRTYLRDHVALMDHLGVERFHVAGMCIGGAYVAQLAAEYPDRVASGVLFQTIGRAVVDGIDNRADFYAMFDDWAGRVAAEHGHMTDSDWARFRATMYDRDFVFSIDEDQARRLRTPCLVLAGADRYHPHVVSRRFADVVPGAEWLDVDAWKTPAAAAGAQRRVRAFLAAHTP